MYSEAGSGLARADRSIAAAEHNVRTLEALIPEMAALGYSTSQIQQQVQILSQALDYVKNQRWEIEGMLGAP